MRQPTFLKFNHGNHVYNMAEIIVDGSLETFQTRVKYAANHSKDVGKMLSLDGGD
jgi:hypothetical protein